MASVGIKDQRIQALRGAAAMLVVILHARETLEWLHLPSFAIASLVPDNGCGALGVDLFFVISGVVMGLALERDASPRAFLRARFVRVVPLFWLAALFTIALSVLLAEPLTTARLANSVTILPVFDRGRIAMPVPTVGWTLAFELYFYLIVAAAMALPRMMRADAVLAALILCALIGGLLQPILVPILGIACNAMLLEFALGLLVLRVARHPLARRFAPLLIAVGAGLLFYAAVIGFRFSNAPEAAVAGQTSFARVICWAFPCALLLAGITARADGLAAKGPLVRLGDASYSIYLWHPSVMLVLRSIWPHTGPIGSDLLFLILVAASAVTGLIAHRFIEQPLLARLRPKTRPPARGALETWATNGA